MKLGERILLNDIANGLEDVAIPVVNDLDDDGPPNVVYLQKRRALPIPDDNGENLVEYLKKESESCPGCQCEGNCNDISQCACRTKTNEEIDRWNNLWKQTTKNRVNPFDEFPLAFYECNDNCSCQKDHCINRLVQKKIRLPLQIFKTPKMGWGIRCAQNIPKATFIATYTGTILQRGFMKKLELLRGKLISGCYMAKLINIAQIYNKKPGEFSTIMDEWEFGVDGGFPVNGPNPGGNVTRFINHSCEPNIISRLVFIDTHDTRLPHLAFFALRDIEAGEEIFWDYAYDASPNSSFNCQCGTEKCRWKKNKET